MRRMMTAISPSLFTFGCMSLGQDLSRLDDYVRVARTAMAAGVWFHASPTYHRGFTYMVLRLAFDEARSQVPPLLIKIRCGSARLLRFEVEDALRRLGVAQIAVAQLVFTETGPGPLVHDFLHGGPIAETCSALRREGKVARFCPQCDVASSAALVPLARRGAFDGFVLYLNPLQQDADAALWQVLQEQRIPLWALRTVAGALGDPVRYEQRRREQPADSLLPAAARLRDCAQRLGCDWTEFCLRYARSVPGLQTTIGGTADMAHLQRFLEVASVAQPLPAEVLAEIDAARGAI